MRFHFGISFRWSTIKKFLFPFLIGILAYFGLNFLSDNSIPLGFINTYALENYETNYYLDYSNVSNYKDTIIDSTGHTFSSFIDYLSSKNYQRKFMVSFYINNNSFQNIYFYIFDDNSTYNLAFYGNRWLSLNFELSSSNNKWFFSYSLSSLENDIYSSSLLTNLETCLNGGSCYNDSKFTTTKTVFKSSSSFDNNNSYSVTVGNSDNYVFYYSSLSLPLSNYYLPNDSNVYYKSIYVDGIKYNNYPFYLDTLSEPEPEPEPEPDEPTDDETNHKSLFYKIFWFDDNTTVLGVLTSIYELLLIYCISMIFLKILTIIKNTRW